MALERQEKVGEEKEKRNIVTPGIVAEAQRVEIDALIRKAWQWR